MVKAAVLGLLLTTSMALTQVQGELLDRPTAEKWIWGPMLRGGENPILDGRPLTAWILRLGLRGGLGLDRTLFLLNFTSIFAGLSATGALAAWAIGQTRRPLPENQPSDHSPGPALELLGALAAAALAATLLLWGFLSIGYSLTYPYDMAAFALAALVMLAAVRGQTVWTAALLVLATLNKESALWLVPGAAAALALALGHIGPNTANPAKARRPTLLAPIARNAALLLGLWLATVAAVRLGVVGLERAGAMASFQAASPDAALSRLSMNLREILLQHRGTFRQNIYWPLLIHVLCLVALRRIPRPLAAFYLGTPLLAAGLLLAGNIHELRLLNDVIPLGAAGIVIVLATASQTATAAPPGWPAG